MGKRRQVEQLDADEIHHRALARRSALEDLAEHDLGAFIELYNPTYDRPEHLRELLDALDLAMREPIFLLVDAAPRHGKTETLINALARFLKYRPTEHVAYCTYAAPLALRKSRRARAVASRAGIWMGDEQRRSGGVGRFDPSSAVSYWQTIDGGSFTAGGRGGSYVGDGYGQIVYDDPYKSRKEADSVLIRENAIETYRMLATRLEPGGSMVISHQAWDDQDVIETVAKEAEEQGAEVMRITLPAVRDAEYDDADNLVGGTPLWDRWSIEELAKRKHKVGPYNWHSQYQQDRRPRGNAIFKGEPMGYQHPQLDDAVILISCDPGLEEDEMKDSSGIAMGACYRRRSRFYTASKPDWETCVDLLLVEDIWLETPELLDHLEAHLLGQGAASDPLWRGSPVLLEEVSAFKALSQMARRTHKRLAQRLVPVTPRGSKRLRAEPSGQAWGEGRIRVRHGAAWVPGFVREAKRFTGRAGGKDNRVDAVTQLFDYADRALAAMAVGAQSAGDRIMVSSPF